MIECKQYDNTVCAILSEYDGQPVHIPRSWCEKMCKPNDPNAAANMLTRYKGCGGNCGKVTNIIKGFGKLAWERITKGKADEETIRRSAICAECDSRTFLNVVEWAVGAFVAEDLPVNHKPGEWDALWCSKCKCCIEAKARVEGEECPLGYWSKARTPELVSV